MITKPTAAEALECAKELKAIAACSWLGQMDLAMLQRAARLLRAIATAKAENGRLQQRVLDAEAYVAAARRALGADK